MMKKNILKAAIAVFILISAVSCSLSMMRNVRIDITVPDDIVYDGLSVEVRSGNRGQWTDLDEGSTSVTLSMMSGRWSIHAEAWLGDTETAEGSIGVDVPALGGNTRFNISLVRVSDEPRETYSYDSFIETFWSGKVKGDWRKLPREPLWNDITEEEAFLFNDAAEEHGEGFMCALDDGVFYLLIPSGEIIMQDDDGSWRTERDYVTSDRTYENFKKIFIPVDPSAMMHMPLYAGNITEFELVCFNADAKRDLWPNNVVARTEGNTFVVKLSEEDEVVQAPDGSWSYREVIPYRSYERFMKDWTDAGKDTSAMPHEPNYSDFTPADVKKFNSDAGGKAVCHIEDDGSKKDRPVPENWKFFVVETDGRTLVQDMYGDWTER